jgi:DNA-binding NtrC family response regulator
MLEQGRKTLVFVVDDEPSIATTTALILRSQGYDARAFTEPLMALEAAQSEAPDLLFSDVSMPGLNGFELSTGVIKDCPQCKVLLFSRHPGTSEKIAAIANGNKFEILAKPLHPADMLNAIQRKLGGTTSHA